MEAIVGESHFKQAVAVVMGEAVKMHCGIVHTHHKLDDLSLGWLQKVAVHRRLGTEDALTQVEVVASGIVVEVGIETEEA